jgi:hypothetical protein
VLRKEVIRPTKHALNVSHVNSFEKGNKTTQENAETRKKKKTFQKESLLNASK